MGRFDKVKNFFRNIFRTQKLLGSGEDIQNVSDLGENKDLFQEKKDKFDAGVQVDLSKKQEEEWKEPVFGQATFLYKGRRLPRAIWLGDTVTQENTEYLGENKYSIKMDNLSLEDTYKLTAQLVDRTDDAVGQLIIGTSEQHGYEQSSHKLRSEMDLAKYLAENGKMQRATERLDVFLLSQLDYYDGLMEKESDRTDEELDQ